MRKSIAVLGFLTLLATVGGADNDKKYSRLMAQARALELDRTLPTIEVRLNRARDKFIEAARQCPARWEAFFELGVNRCKRAFWMHGEAQDHITLSRARGLAPARLTAMEVGAKAQIETELAETYRWFKNGFERQERLYGERDQQLVRVANAFTKFAAREYLRAKQGRPGAIADFQALLRSQYNETLCRNHIAMCYLDLGVEAYGEQDYKKAQDWWDKALRWAKASWLRRMIYSNKAGAYELDSEFALAEKLLQKQIAEEPGSPVHHKNLGLVAGFQNRLPEAAYYYRKARELCARDPNRRLAFFHGNAWLRAAEIHGHLLERNGDVLLAWRLFMEYRARHGDNYNFAIAFGRFASINRRYSLAWRFFQHAAKLQPHCTVPFLELIRIAPRVGKTREEADQLSADTKERLEKVQARYAGTDEPHDVARVCAGLRDDPRLRSSPKNLAMEGDDPFAELSADKPPAWVQKITEEREPYEPWTPGKARTGTKQTTGTDGDVATETDRSRLWLLAGVLGAAVILVGILFANRAAAA